MRSLNALHNNGADKLLEKYVLLAKDRFKQNLIGTMMGIAFGGDVEMCARHWKVIGDVFGYDTFEGGHPKFLSANQNSYEATCMDLSYATWGTAELSYDWQLSQLKKAGLDNAHLIKGLVRPNSCNRLDHINLAWLDMDMNRSMLNGYIAVCAKMVPGAYLVMHDVVPKGHIPNNFEIFYELLFDSTEWESVEVVIPSYFCAWLKK